MSSRALRKALKESEPALEVEEQDLDLLPTKSKQKNVFDLLDLEEVLPETESDSEFEIPDATPAPKQAFKPKSSKPPKEKPQKKQKAIQEEQKVKSILCVNLKGLNFASELQKSFGSSVVNRSSSTAAKRVSTFVDLKGNWNRIPTGGIEMHFDEAKSCFQLIHSARYQELQEHFVEIVQLSDPQILTDFLRAHPVHIDTMLTLSDVFKINREISSSAEFVERALFTLERAFHPSFLAAVAEGDFAKGELLSYSHYENRAVFLCLYRHLQFVMRKGCWKTAFELGKFILNLSFQQDPIGMLHILDFLALRAEEYDFIAEFAAKCLKDRLPNWLYSQALALFFKNDSQADAQLKMAILSFPGLLGKLNDKCGFHLKLPQVSPLLVKEPIFSLESDFWNESQRKINNSEKLYVERAHLCFKLPRVSAWIQRVLSSISPDSPEWSEHLLQRKNPVQERGFGTFRHLLLADVEDSRFYLPRSISSIPTTNWDLLPPANAPVSYADAFSRRQSGGLSSFLSSILPSFSFGSTNDDSIIQDA